MLGTDAAALETGLLATQAESADIVTDLEGVATSEELGLISNTLAELQADVTELLESNAVINANISIIDPSKNPKKLRWGCYLFK